MGYLWTRTAVFMGITVRYQIIKVYTFSTTFAPQLDHLTVTTKATVYILIHVGHQNQHHARKG